MFQTSAPVTGFVFHDRVVEMQRMDRVVEALAAGTPRWLAIVGVRKVGKTSLVLEAARRMEAKGQRIRFVSLDVFESSPVSLSFFYAFALRVADRLLVPSLGLSVEALAPHPDLYRQELAQSSVFGKLPGPLRAELLALPGRTIDAAFVKWALDLPERLAQATQQRVIISIDEFQELASLGNERNGIDPLPLMRSLWQRHKAVTYIVSGSARTMLTELVTSQRSPFFQHFDLMPLGAFAPQDAVELLTHYSPRGRKIPLHVARKAVTVMGGHPFYLQVFGEALVEREPPYDDADLKDTLQTLIFSRTGRLALYFQNEFERIVGRSAQMAAALTALAERPYRLSGLAHHLKMATGSTARALERIGDAVEKRDDEHYHVSDFTFALWLRWRAPGGAVVPMTVIGDEAEKAVAAHLAASGFDLIYQSRASRGAFDLMATRGAAQLGIQVKRMDLPLRFTATAWKRMEAEAERFGWRWLVIAVDENHNTVLLDPARAKRGKQLTLDATATIENVLRWLDHSAAPRFKPKR